MRDAIIDMIDAFSVVAVIIVTGICMLIGFQISGMMGFILGGAAFIGMGFTVGMWLCLSGIYHHTKTIARNSRATKENQTQEV